jgi:fatty acid-binding protein DegV
VDLVHANKNNELNDKFIVDYLNNVRDKRAGILIVPDVTQLKKGGRVSNFKSILIKLLNLKLILTLDKSGLLFRDKANKPDEVIRRSKKILEELIPLDKSHIKRFTVLTNDETDKKFNMNEYLDVLKATYPKVEIEYDQIPTIILAHVGPNYFVFGIDLE